MMSCCTYLINLGVSIHEKFIILINFCLLITKKKMSKKKCKNKWDLLSRHSTGFGLNFITFHYLFYVISPLTFRFATHGGEIPVSQKILHLIIVHGYKWQRYRVEYCVKPHSEMVVETGVASEKLWPSASELKCCGCEYR